MKENIVAKHAALAWLQTQQASMLEKVYELVHINSGTMHLAGLQAVAALLEKYFSPLADKTQWLTLQGREIIDAKGAPQTEALGQGLLFEKNPQAAHRVLLVGHMDTVFPKDDSFQSITELDDNTINGPGVADMKGGLVVMLSALQALEQLNWSNDYGWSVYIAPDEEIGSPGSAPILAQLAGQHEIGLVYEPAVNATGLLAGARKGSGKFTLVVRGQAAHAGRDFYSGKNAIVGLSHWITAVNAANGQRDGVTINIGQIEGGGALNVVPDLAITRIDVRTQQVADEAWVQAIFASATEQVEQAYGLNITLHGGFGRKPKPMTGNTLKLFNWVKLVAQDLSLDLNWQPTGGCCDGNNLADAGLPTIDTLGVRGGNIHSHAEFMCCDSLVERAQLTAYLLTRIATGEWQKEV